MTPPPKEPDNNVSVFISYKHEYGAGARELRDKLHYLGAGRLRFFLSEDIPAGESWREWIDQRLGEANLLLFLFMNPSRSWDWCLYEMGLFAGIGQGRIIVLHHPGGEAPDPLRDLQAVPATREKVKQFLRDLYGGDAFGISQPPINEPLANDEKQLNREADSICGLFSDHSTEAQILLNEISVHVGPTEGQAGTGIPDDSVLEADAETLRLVGLMKDPGKKWTWGEVYGNIHDNRWMDLLATGISSWSRGKAVAPVDTSFSLRDGKIFSAFLHRRVAENDGTHRYHILLVEQATKAVVSKAPEQLATLLSTLTLGSRFQWELCNRFLIELRDWHSDEDRSHGCDAILRTMDNIHEEAMYRERWEFPNEERRRERDRLVWAFDSIEDQRVVAGNLNKQNDFKEALRIALRERKMEEIEVLLRNLQGLNMLLVDKICARYGALLAQVPRESSRDLDAPD